MKYTTNRLSCYGLSSTGPFGKDYCREQTIIETSMGPLTKTVRDLIAVSRYMIGEDTPTQWSFTYPLKFNEEEAMYDYQKPGAKKLRIGCLNEFSFCEVSPPNKRALQMVKNALIKEGHTVIDYEIPKEYENIIRMFRLLSCDGQYDDFIDNNWKYGDPILETYASCVLFKSIPNWIKYIFHNIFSHIPSLKR